MVAKKLTKKVASRGDITPELTPAQFEVYHLLTDEFLTEKQIATRRGSSRQAVNRIIKKLKEKGLLNDVVAGGCKIDPPVSLKGMKNHNIIIKQWRYHALHFVVKPYYFFPRYHKIREERGGYGINYREWIIKLHPDMVEVQLKSGEDFADPDKWEATRKAEASFNRTLREVSEKFGFSVWKKNHVSIKLVNQELARNPSEIANTRNGEYLTVAGHDGKIWFKVDCSKGAEHEYSHPERTLSDSEKIEPYFNDMLYNEPATLSQIMGTINQISQAINHLARVNQETASGLNAVVTYLKAQLPQEEKPIINEQMIPPSKKPYYVG